MWKRIFCVEVEKFDGTRNEYGRGRLESVVNDIYQDIIKETKHPDPGEIKPWDVREVRMVCRWVRTGGVYHE